MIDGSCSHPPGVDATDEIDCCGAGASLVDADEAVALADRLGAIADPVRIQILSILATSPTGEVCACDFVTPTGKSQPTVSHHLKVLAEAGLVDGDKRGRWVWYRLVDGAVALLLDTLKSAVPSTTQSGTR